jgi:hypothetical protein
MGSDRNYQQIPHRKQYPVPKIYLPEPAWDTTALFDMSHPIDMGDLVFIVNMNYKHYVLTGSQRERAGRPEQHHAQLQRVLQHLHCQLPARRHHNYAMHFMRDNNQVNKNHTRGTHALPESRREPGGNQNATRHITQSVWVKVNISK